MKKNQAITALWIGVALICALMSVPRAPESAKRSANARQNGGSQESAGTRGRMVYPYSVISGGARSQSELKAALLRDPVAARHYAGFDLDRTRLEVSSKPRLAYVSYRLADRVYWTQNRVRIPSGEAVLTDGVNQARARCGNRISDDKPPQEVAGLAQFSPQEPSEAMLDSQIPESFQTGHLEMVSNLIGADRLGDNGLAPSNYDAAFGSATRNLPEALLGGTSAQVPQAGSPSASGGFGGGAFLGGVPGASGSAESPHSATPSVFGTAASAAILETTATSDSPASSVPSPGPILPPVFWPASGDLAGFPVSSGPIGYFPTAYGGPSSPPNPASIWIAPSPAPVPGYPSAGGRTTKGNSLSYVQPTRSTNSPPAENLAVPEPGPIWLAAAGVAALVVLYRFRRSRAVQ